MINTIEKFSGFDSFATWFGANQITRGSILDAIKIIQRDGINSNFFGYISPQYIEVSGGNFRENLKATGLNSRQRAILEMMILEIKPNNFRRTKIYAPEAVTDLACVLRGKFPWFIGSEYANNVEEEERIYPIVCQDLQDLSLKSDAFDLVITCDVLEHVADIPRSLSEMARVLKQDGVMLSTHPFTWRQNSFVKAELRNGSLIHFVEPEYHGNPVNPEKGSLVFTVPGWDILEMCLNSGFKKAEMIIIASASLGIFSHDIGYINVLRAQK